MREHDRCRSPPQRGFDEFYGFTRDHSHDQYDADYYIRLPEGRKKEIDPPRGEFYATDVFNAYALEFLRRGQESGAVFRTSRGAVSHGTSRRTTSTSSARR